MKDIQEIRDKAVLLGWIAGLLMLISLIWIFSQPVQAHYLLRSINNVLIYNNDERRVINYIQKKPGKTGLIGYWFSMNNTKENMFVFTVFKDGILVPLGAIVSDAGNVQEIIPLSAHAVQIINNLPQSVLQMYIRRIEVSL
jgi:hypothetical protein